MTNQCTSNFSPIFCCLKKKLFFSSLFKGKSQKRKKFDPKKKERKTNRKCMKRVVECNIDFDCNKHDIDCTTAICDRFVMRLV